MGSREWRSCGSHYDCSLTAPAAPGRSVASENYVVLRGSAPRDGHDPATGHRPCADPNPMAARARRPHLEAELLEPADLARDRDLVGHADDHDAPAGTTAGLDAIDLERGLLGPQQSVQLGTLRGTEHH